MTSESKAPTGVPILQYEQPRSITLLNTTTAREGHQTHAVTRSLFLTCSHFISLKVTLGGGKENNSRGEKRNGVEFSTRRITFPSSVAYRDSRFVGGLDTARTVGPTRLTKRSLHQLFDQAIQPTRQEGNLRATVH